MNATDGDSVVQKEGSPPPRTDRRLLFRALGIGALLILAAGIGVGVLAYREATQLQECRANLIALGWGTSLFDEVHRRLPTGGEGDRTGERSVSWRVWILPYIENQALFDDYDTRQPWDAEVNRRVAETMPYDYRCPSEGRSEETTLTSYFAIDGEGTLFEKGTSKRPKDVPDGAAQTLMFVESHGRNVVWTEPRDISPAEATGDPGLRSSHWAGTGAVFADGSVGFLSSDIDPIVLKHLTTDSGGEPVPDP